MECIAIAVPRVLHCTVLVRLRGYLDWLLLVLESTGLVLALEMQA
jgi:hypothetical protein